MRVLVGSANPVKIGGGAGCVRAHFPGAEVEGIEACVRGRRRNRWVTRPLPARRIGRGRCWR